MKGIGALEQYFVWILLAYFVVQTILRVTVAGHSIALDESEQVIVSQAFSLHYGAQPPLYTWLQILVFHVVGVSILGVALLKNALLFTLYCFSYLAARRITADARLAMAATLALLLLPEIAWEFERDRSHVVLATAIGSMTVYAFVRLAQAPATARYIALGVLVGLGFLSKLSYAAFFLPLVLATLITPELRRLVLDRRFALSLAVAAAVFLPHGVWLWNHVDVPLANVQNKIAVQPNFSVWRVPAQALGNLLLNVLIFVLPLLLFYGLFFRRFLRGASAARQLPYSRWLGWYLLLMLGTLWVVMMGLDGTDFRGRWLSPMLFVVPLYLFLRLGPQATQARAGSGFMLTAGVMALTVSAGVAGRIVFSSDSNLPYLQVPYRALAEQIRQTGFSRGTIIAEPRQLAAGLRIQFPGSTVLTRLDSYPLAHVDVSCPALAVWYAPQENAPAPDSLRAALQLTGLRVREFTLIRRLRLPYEFRPDASMPVNVAQAQDCTAASTPAALPSGSGKTTAGRGPLRASPAVSSKSPERLRP